MRRLLAGSCLLALTAVACGGTDIQLRAERPQGRAFVTQVADSEDKVGIGVSLAVEGNGAPHLSYLAFLPELEPGQPEPTNDPLGIQYPAVKHAHFVEGAWTRSVVSEQPPAGSDEKATPPATEQDATAIVLDAQGVHHIVWTAGSHLLYSHNAEGAFSTPEEVFRRGDLQAPAIAIGPDGTPVASVFDGEVVWGAARFGGEWQVERIAADVLGSPVSTAIGFARGITTVAYAGGGGVVVARRGAQGWTTENVDPDGRGGVDLDVDGDGNPHLSYYAGLEVRHAHSIGGAPWEISVVGESLGPDPGSATSIALDVKGVHHIEWDDGEGIAYANNAGGEFGLQEIPGAFGGTDPAIASGEEIVSLAWFDAVNGNVKISILTDEEPLLALPGAGEEPTEEPTGGPPTGTPPCEASGTELSITAPQGAFTSGFETDCLAAPAGKAFTIDFANQDEGLAHNVTIYPSQQETSSPLGGGGASNTITGPDSTTYEVDPLEAGIYFFQCDVHPTTMTGTFVAQ
ncbi:MAG: cupredoxin domain-containing protein [Actinomycetota bacterium]